MADADIGWDAGQMLALAESLNAIASQWGGELDVADVAPAGLAVDHGELASALAEFGSRWDRGVNDLIRNSSKAAEYLAYVIDDYDVRDAAGAAQLASD